MSGRIGDETRPAPALLEIVECADLARYFELLPIDRIVPALDVDRPGVACEPEFADHPRPVRIAEAGRAHLDERHLAEHPVLANDIPTHGSVLAVNMEEFWGPLADLWDRFNEIHQLVTGLPLEPDILGRKRVEHQLPGVGIVGDVPVAARPVAVHRAILEGQAHAPAGGAARKFAPDFLVRRQTRLDRLFAHAAGEPGYGLRPEMMGVVDQRLPACERLAVEVAALQRIAEHAERIDGHVGVADRLTKLLRKKRQILVHGLPEERLDALEAELDNLPDISRGVGRVRLDHRS